MPLTVGEKLGPYEIIAPIGAGGMGDVYKARDTRLDRIVAIKVSKTEFSERFEREARAVAALNHSNICTLHDVGPNYLVMEYIDGAPLKGPLPVDQALRYAVQICDALDAAHKKGITHRDLKPANILVTKSGIKLLDFGLAKLGTSGVGQTVKSPSEATLTMALTGKNEIVGTLYYMSPEQLHAQATGQEIDGRSDIFSFGLVVHEMLTGKRAFEGSSPASVIAAIMERPAPSIADVAPAALDRALKRCLEKDPDNRWQTAHDLKAELEWIATAPEAASSAASQSRLGRVWPGVAALFALVAAALAFFHFGETPPVAEVKRFQVAAPEGLTFAGDFALSPDGRNLAYLAAGTDGVRRLWALPMNSLEAKPLAEGIIAFGWSPDSRSIRGGNGTANRKIDLATGSTETIAGVGALSGTTWNQEGVGIQEEIPGLSLIPTNGGVHVRLPISGNGTHPLFLPDGKHFLFYSGGPQPGIYVASIEGNTPPKLLKPHGNQTNFGFTPISKGGAAGYLLFASDTSLVAQRLELNKLELSGDAITILNGIARRGGGTAFFSVADDGTLAYRAGGRERISILFDRQGKELGSFPGEASLALSPDGSKAAVQSSQADARTGDRNILLVDLARHTSEKFTFDTFPNNNPVWSPDGSRIAYTSKRGDTPQRIYVKPANGAQVEELLFPSDVAVVPNSWSRDGKYLVFMRQDPKTNWDLWIYNFADRKAQPFLQSEFSEMQGEISPDGRWIAYTSLESGRQEVYVRSFPGGTGKWLVSRDGGNQPKWRRDGHELFFRKNDAYTPEVLAVEVIAGGAFQAGVPTKLFDMYGPSPGPNNPYYDVTADGQKFLVTAYPPETTAAPITVVLNWQAGLKK